VRRPDKPIVKDGLLWAAGEISSAANSIPIGSRRWQAWLATNTRFAFEGGAGHFSAQSELRRGIAYWYAYRRRGGRLFKTYLGKSEELTPERLEQASAQLAGHAPLTRLAGKADSSDLALALKGVSGGAAGAAEADETLLSVLPLTKIKPPVLPEKLIERPRLTQRIKSPATFIYAPSGFGKSTLLNEWRQACSMPVAWVSLDADDNQPSRFWFTLGTALQVIDPGLGRAWLKQLRISPRSNLSQIVVSLANEIVRATDAPGAFHRFGLVLDDYHHIQHPDIHASLQTLIEHLPPALQLVVSSRTRPPLILGQLRARGTVTELDTDDLRFTLEEGIDFLWRYTSSRHLSFNEMQTLVKHTEGWVAGLHLATLALAQHSDRHQVMAAFTGAHTYLREYFTESVLYRQSPAVQAFLFKTAILRHLTAPLCDAVTGQADGAEMLGRLWQENLFLVRLEEPGWYRYHDLFAEMLYSQLQLQFPAEIPRLHRRAAEWYRAHNAPADAVYHLLTIQAWEEAAALIENLALRELEQFGEDSRLLRWLQQLPETVVQQHKTLLFVYVRLAGMALSKNEVEGFLTRVEANLARKSADEQTPDEQDVLNDTRRLRQVLRTGSSVTSQLSVAGENDAVSQILNGILLLHRFNCPDVNKADTVAHEVYEAARGQRNLFVMLMAGGEYAQLAYLQGHLRRGEKIGHQVLQEALAQRGTLPEPASITLSTLSRVYFGRNQIAQARQFLLRASDVDPNPTSSNQLIAIAIQQAKIEMAQGQSDAAQVTLQSARELHARRPSGVWLDQDLIAYQAWMCVRHGDCHSAEQILSEASDAEPHALSLLVRAEMHLRQGRHAAAEDILTRLLLQYPCGFYYEPMLAARVMLAVALFEQHKACEARQVMTEAIRLAAPEAFLRPFLDHGSQSVPLLTLVLHTETLTADAYSFAKEVLRMLGQADGAQTPPSKDELTALATAASISAREQEVLRLVSAGLSNREIARQFSISVSTVKTHLDNIYRKLDVSSRMQAAAQAQALGLVEAAASHHAALGSET
jgi:LuxR family maltose regulon positive regulatory protein